MKDIFNPDSYTEKAMPISTALFKAINDLGTLDHSSDAVNAFIEKHKAAHDKFINSLTKEQWDMYSDIQWDDTEETWLNSVESFNRGLRFGVLLIRELLP